MECCRYCTTETGRKVGCHGTCEKYIKESEQSITKKRIAYLMKKYAIM